MATKDKILKDNLNFVYGRNQVESQIPDPDKVEVVRTYRKASDYELTKDEMINEFTGDWESLSPLFKSPVMLSGDLQPYPTFEHALQASKFLEVANRDAIRTMEDIREVKRFVTKYKDLQDKLVTNWNEQCLTIAKKLLRDKFMRNKTNKIRLMKTGHKALRYDNEYNDLYWGYNKTTKKGQNHLGKLLEEIRKEISEGTDIDRWIVDHKKIITPVKVRVTMNAYEGKHAIEEEKKVLDEKVIVSIGKDDANDYMIAHPSVSRVHCCVVVTLNEEAFLVDMQSSNGTKVNGVKLEPFTFQKLDLRGEDLIQIGEVTKMYRIEINPRAEAVRHEELLQKLLAEDNQGKKNVDEYSIFIRNLPKKLLDNELYEFFEDCGTILRLQIPRDKMTNESRGIAFVSFETFAGMMQALSKDEEEFQGQFLKIKRSDPKKSLAPSTQATSSSASYKPSSQPQHQRPRSEGRDGQRKNINNRNEPLRVKEERVSRFENVKFKNDPQSAQSSAQQSRRGRSRDRSRGPEERRNHSRDRKENNRKDVNSRDRDRGKDRNREKGERSRDDSRRRSRRSNSRPKYRSSRDNEDTNRGMKKRSRTPDRSSPPRKKSHVQRESTVNRAQSTNDSPPRRSSTSRSTSNSPPRRSTAIQQSRASPSATPPRRLTAARSDSGSPPRRPNQAIKNESSPPRRVTRSPSATPPRRPVRASSESPPRRPNQETTNQPSPPRRVTRSPSATPPRRSVRDSSSSPPRRPTVSASSDSPPRRATSARQSPSSSFSPPRRGK
jgi:ribA/ribD-fused uncharacterized protein